MRSLVRRLARHAGLEIRRYAPDSSERARLTGLLRARAIDLVLDVGANTGQYARELRELGYAGRIVSFEPLREAHEALARAAAGDLHWTVAPRMALGEHDGEADLNVSENLASSSVLTASGIALAAEPLVRANRRERAPMARLDGAATRYLTHAQHMFLKIDVQGYEPQVLAGASGLLGRIEGIQLEMSLVPLYEGQALLWELNDRLERLGFSAHALMPGFSDPLTGRLLQLDGVYFRS
jgi:FkbM family methyltransferase